MKRPAIFLSTALVSLLVAGSAVAADPLSPTTVRSEKLSPTQARITWNDRANNEDGFQIFRLKQPSDNFQSRGTVGPNVESFNDTVDPGEIYVYHVISFNEDGDSDPSNQCFVGKAAPAKPIDIYARLIALYVVRVSWVDRSNGETGFAIQRARDDEGFKTIAVVEPNVESYDDEELSPAHTYKYRVRALGRPNRCIKDSKVSEERTVTTKGGVKLLTIDLAGTGRGVVTSEPEGLRCGPQERQCTAEFPIGTHVFLSGDPNSTSKFRTWLGPNHCEGSNKPCEIFLNDDRSVTAVFKRDND